LTEFSPPRILKTYAHALHAASDVLLHPDTGVWVVRTGFLTPTRRTEGGFRFYK
jgi:hypothetical protein